MVGDAGPGVMPGRRPTVAASMQLLTFAQRRPAQLVNRRLGPVPYTTPFHVTLCHQLVGALCGV